MKTMSARRRVLGSVTSTLNRKPIARRASRKATSPGVSRRRVDYILRRTSNDDALGLLAFGIHFSFDFFLAEACIATSLYYAASDCSIRLM